MYMCFCYSSQIRVLVLTTIYVSDDFSVEESMRGANKFD